MKIGRRTWLRFRRDQTDSTRSWHISLVHNTVNEPATYRVHDFVLGARIVEPQIPDRWHRVHARCQRCGERRLVYHAVFMDDLNIGPCIPDRKKEIR